MGDWTEKILDLIQKKLIEIFLMLSFVDNVRTGTVYCCKTNSLKRKPPGPRPSHPQKP